MNEMPYPEMIRDYAPDHGLALTAAKVALITDLVFPPPQIMQTAATDYTM